MPIPPSVLVYGFAGAAAMIVAALSTLIWPSPESITHGGFFLLAKSTLAGFVGLLKVLAIPFVLAGIVALAVTVYLAVYPRQKVAWHYACVGEFVVGVGALGASALVLLAIVLTAIIWLVIIIAILGAVVLFLGALGE